MILTELHPEVTTDQVRENFGWDIKISRKLKSTVPPTEEELRIIREDLDPERIHLRG
jgi:glutaconate CoA-transferase subunit B